MDEKTSKRRVIELTEAATYDLAAIDNATAQQWGEAQANRYVAYMRETLAYLAAQPSIGASIEGWPGSLIYVARHRKRRSAHGHRIFYMEIKNGILVLRILHTAMNWPDHLGIDSDSTGNPAPLKPD